MVFDDADLDSVVEGVVDAIWFNQGQVCCAGSRILAHEGIAEELADRYLIAWGLEWQAMAEVELGESARAGLLIGAGEGARRAHGGGWSPAVLGIADAPTRLRSALGDRAAEAAIAAGRELNLEAALEVARGNALP